MSEYEAQNGGSIAEHKPSEGERGEQNKANPAAVELYLKGIQYPADKKTLVQQARSNKAPDDVMRVLDRLADKNYQSTVDVNKEASRMG